MYDNKTRPILRPAPLFIAAMMAIAASSALPVAAQGRRATPRETGAQSAATASREETSSQAAPTQVLDLNSATAAELEELPGIGPAKAQAIVALRNRLGRFGRVEDLMRVRGIGRATFRRLRPLLTLGAVPREGTAGDRGARGRSRGQRR